MNLFPRLCLFVLLAGSYLFTSAQGGFTVKGTITNATSLEAKLLVYKNYLPALAEVYNVQIKNDNFLVTAKSEKPVYAELNFKGRGLRVYAEPGDELVIGFTDDGQMSNTSVAGKGADNNLFLSVFHKKFPLNDSLKLKQMFTVSIDVWENQLFTLKKEQTDFLSTYPDKDKLSSKFIKTIKNEIDYQYWCLLLAYPIIKANSSQQILQVEQIPAVMIEELGKVKLNNEEALINDVYRSFVYYYIVYHTSQANGFNKFRDYSTAADRKLAVAKAKLTGDVLNTWLAQFCLDEKDMVAPFMLKNMLSNLKESDKGLKYYPFVSKASEKNLSADKAVASADKQAGVAKQSKDNQASKAADDDAGLKDINGKPFSLSSLKGKVVYIDFWASWCGPCRVMMPYSKQMHDKLTDKQKKDIVFLYISIDADEVAWKKSMEAMGMQGVMAISPGNWSSKACRYFQINSIPRYMIMDKKGNIVDYNAKRPADPAVLDDLLKLATQ